MIFPCKNIWQGQERFVNEYVTQLCVYKYTREMFQLMCGRNINVRAIPYNKVTWFNGYRPFQLNWWYSNSYFFTVPIHSSLLSPCLLSVLRLVSR